MERLTNFNEYQEQNESFIAMGYGSNSGGRAWSLGAVSPGLTGYDFKPIAHKLDESLNDVAADAWDWENDSNPEHKGEHILEGAKDYVNKRLDEMYESCQNESVTESTEDYNPGEKMQQLKRRAAQNRDRYKDAQERGDNYAIKYYELRMRLDKLDEEKAKLHKEVKKLKQKFGKFKN